MGFVRVNLFSDFVFNIMTFFANMNLNADPESQVDQTTHGSSETTYIPGYFNSFLKLAT